MSLWTALRLSIILALLMLMGWGCGGDQNIQSLIDLKAPGPVGNVQAFPADQKVRVIWTPLRDPDLVGYNIYRSTATAQGYELVGSSGITQTPFWEDLGPDLNSDGIPDGLVNNIRYFYKVAGFDRNGRETSLQLSASVSAVPGALAPGTADLQVVNVRGYAGDQRGIVTWDPNLDPNVFAYNIYRSDVGAGDIFQLVGIVPQGINSFTEADLTNQVEIIYQVAPITRDLAEGRRTQGRPLRPQPGNATIPKPPSHDRGNGPVTATQVSQGIFLTWGRPTENTDGTVIIQANFGLDDLVGGGYLIHRARGPEGQFRVVGIIENMGTEATVSYTDPFGLPTDFYYLTAFDNTGNESFPSDIVSPGTFVPAMVSGVDAFASASIGQIVVVWNISPQAVDGYRVFRSLQRDAGYVDVSGLLPNNVSSFTDSGGLELGATYYYKVLAESNGIRGSLSPPAPATPGPSSGTFWLEGEDATVLVNDPTHFAALNRVALPEPFSSNGALFIRASDAAIVGQSFVQMDYSVDIDATQVTPVVRSYDAILVTIRNSSSGIFGITVGELLAATLNPPLNCPPLQVTAKDFFRSRFGFPPVPVFERIGAICFPSEESVPPAGNFGPNENVRMTLTYQGANPAIAQGRGELFIDALILLRR